MIYVMGFEPRALEIYYNTGSGKGKIKIIIQWFLDGQTITKIKKLLNIIRTSQNPEAELVIADYCRQWLSEYEVEQKILANKYAVSKERVGRIKSEIVYDQRILGRCSKNTELYKKYAELLKSKKKELAAVEASVRFLLAEINRNQKSKSKYEKILAFMNQG